MSKRDQNDHKSVLYYMSPEETIRIVMINHTTGRDHVRSSNPVHLICFISYMSVRTYSDSRRVGDHLWINISKI